MFPLASNRILHLSLKDHLESSLNEPQTLKSLYHGNGRITCVICIPFPDMYPDCRKFVEYNSEKFAKMLAGSGNHARGLPEHS